MSSSKRTSTVPGYLFDTSVWIALSFDRHRSHGVASAFLPRLSSEAPAFLCRATEQSWMRLLSTPALHRLYRTKTLSNKHCRCLLEDWRSRSYTRTLDSEPEGTRALWLELASLDSASPKVWMDAYLAAFAIRGKLRLVTLDRDFRSWVSKGLELELPAC